MRGDRLMVGLVVPALAIALLGGVAGRPQLGEARTPHDTEQTAARPSLPDLEPSPTPESTPNGDGEWAMTIDGLVQTPLNLTLDDLLAMPATTVFARLYCVGLPTNPLNERHWTGVKLSFLLEQAGVSPEAVKVAFYASDGFMSDLTITSAMKSNVLIAYENEGQPLIDVVRLVVPGKWGYKWIMGITHIELLDYNFLGTYETNGYPDEADIPGYWPAVGGLAELPDDSGPPQTATESPFDSPWTWVALAGVVIGGAGLGAGLSWRRFRRAPVADQAPKERDTD